MPHRNNMRCCNCESKYFSKKFRNQWLNKFIIALQHEEPGA
jgi:hypothetical protein